MEKITIKSRSINKNKNTDSNIHQRKSSHDCLEFFMKKNKNDTISYPLIPKVKIRSKFFKSKIKINLPKLEDTKIILPNKYSIVSSRLINYNKSAANNNKCKNSIPNLNFPRLTQNKSQIYERVDKLETKRKSTSFIKLNNCHLNSVKNNNKKIQIQLEQKNIKDYSSASLAGKNEYGQTKTNQDSFLILTNINNFTNYNIFSIFDGHGKDGHLVSQFLVNYFSDFFKNNSQIIKCKSEIQLLNLFIDSDFKFLRDAVKNSEKQLSLEEDIDSKNSGSTLCILISVYTKIICMNVGDSRAILSVSEIFRNDIKVLSVDHKPSLKKEQDRIRKSGGYVEKFIYEDGIVDDTYRVWDSPSLKYPGLAISRSIGDTDVSSLGVISDPDFCVKTLKKEMNFAVIASDGIWEFLDNKEVCDFVKYYYLNGNAKNAADELVKKSRQIWDERGKEVDDITVIIIFF